MFASLPTICNPPKSQSPQWKCSFPGLLFCWPSGTDDSNNDDHGTYPRNINNSNNVFLTLDEVVTTTIPTSTLTTNDGKDPFLSSKPWIQHLRTEIESLRHRLADLKDSFLISDTQSSQSLVMEPNQLQTKPHGESHVLQRDSSTEEAIDVSINSKNRTSDDWYQEERKEDLEENWAWQRIPPSKSTSTSSAQETMNMALTCSSHSVPDIPLNVLVDLIAPFIADRLTFNAFAMANKEIRQACLDTIPFPPWPSSLFNVGNRLWSVAFSPDNRTLVVGATNGGIQLVDRQKGPMERLTGHLGRIYSIVFTNDGRTMMTLSGDGDVRIWNMEENTLQQQVATRSTHSVCLAFNATTMQMAMGGEGDIKHYSIPQGIGLDVWTLERHSYLVESIAFSPDGNYMAAGTGGHVIHIWDVQMRACITTLQESRCVHSVAYSPDGQYLVAGTDSSDIRVWKVATQEFQTLYGHGDMVWSVAWSSNGNWIASASDDGTVRIWSAETMTCVRTLHGRHKLSSVYSVAFSPNGGTVASTSNDGYIELWNATPLAVKC